MKKEELEDYLHRNIPLSKAMGLSVGLVEKGKVILKAPFEPNVNHKKTVFGGSLATLATLACWSLLYASLKQFESQHEIVVVHSDISYLRPVKGEFEAVCVFENQEQWGRFLTLLQRKNKGKIVLEALIGDIKEPSVIFKGTFAALSQVS